MLGFFGGKPNLKLGLTAENQDLALTGPEDHGPEVGMHFSAGLDLVSKGLAAGPKSSSKNQLIGGVFGPDWELFSFTLVSW